jgi:hypothetical protein
MLKPKVVLTGGGTGPITFFLARGDFELGIQQTDIMVGDGDNVASHRITIFTSMSSLSGVTDSVSNPEPMSIPAHSSRLRLT